MIVEQDPRQFSKCTLRLRRTRILDSGMRPSGTDTDQKTGSRSSPEWSNRGVHL